MPDPRHRVELSRTAVIITALVVFISGALGAWGVGRLADRGVQAITDTGPLGVDVEYSGATTLVIPEKGVANLSPEIYGDEYRRAALTLGAIDVETQIVFYLFGEADTPVVIKAIDAVDVECEEADGRWVGATQDVGGYLPELFLQIQLKAGADEAPGIPISNVDEPESDWKFSRDISRAEIEKFRAIVAAPPTAICSYSLSVTYRHEGKDRKRRIDDDGAPFRIAGEDIVEPTLAF
ncbi:hypothetical protein ACIO3S_06510 [Nocardioides sp. NPDC087217]|uniref:hypothetical protein n=1 Tax=Nocardioides sp. NPDC087217 TaxID=3364335 RepID=UPI00380BB405